jgi:tripartite-type tricarboxylate transporter receptor subunit TctC
MPDKQLTSTGGVTYRFTAGQSPGPGRLHRRTLLSVLLTSPFATSAFAQSYPDRPIRMVVPFAPAGITDVSARLVAQQMSVSLGQSIVIENRSGGGGSIGTTAVARAEPDGYTLLVVSSATNAILPAMFERLDYDPINSFMPIAKVSTAPYLLVVNANVPVKNARELADYAKANSKFSFAAPTGTPPHILAAVFKELTGADFSVALYKGGGPAMTDLLGNQVQAIFQATTIILPLKDDKRVRILGIAAKERSSLLPNVPTLAEQGFPLLIADSWNGLAAPAGTPAPIVSRLNKAVNEALNAPELKERYAKLAISANIMSTGQFGTFMKEEAVRWAALVKASKLPKVR